MHRDEFLKALRKALSGLQPQERERYLSNYRELIEDKVESGMSEDKAIAEFGDVMAIAQPILSDAQEQGLLKPKRSPLTIALLALGSPIWLALVIAAAAAAFSAYIVLWALIVSLCAVEISLIVVAPASVIYFAVNAGSNLPFSLFVLGMGFVCAAIALALFHPILRCAAGLASASASMARRFINYLKTKGSALL